MRPVILIAVGILFAGMGVFALVAPARLTEPFAIPVTTASGRSEVRAVYGGFGLAVAGALGWAALDAGDLRRGVVIAIAIALAGMAAGRVISRLVDSRVAFYPIWFYFWVEVAGAVALLAVA